MIEPVWEFEVHGMRVRGVMHECEQQGCFTVMEFVGSAADADAWVAFGQTNQLVAPAVLEDDLLLEDAETNARLGAVLGVKWENLTHAGMMQQLRLTLTLSPGLVNEIEAATPDQLRELRRLTTHTPRGRDGVLNALAVLREQRERAVCEGPVREWLS